MAIDQNITRTSNDWSVVAEYQHKRSGTHEQKTNAWNNQTKRFVGASKITEQKKQRKGKAKLVDITTGEETIFHSINEASKKTGKGSLFLRYNNGRTWNNKK